MVSAKGERADRLLSRLDGLPSRSQLKSWFEAKQIRRGEQVLEPKHFVFVGDEIEVKVPPPREMNIDARKMDLDIRFEDEDLLVLVKPRGLSMHPGASKDDETTLVHALLAHSKLWSDHGGEFRPGIVHRLDKDTEGLVVVAKNNEVHESLSDQFAMRTIERRYWALCAGKVPSRLTIEGNIGRHPVHRKKMAITERGKEAKTEVKRLEYFEDGHYSWVECKLFSGRTHQIRVHLASKKFPVLNDPLYARPRKIAMSAEKTNALQKLKGQALIAFELGFTHPITKKVLHFELEKPEWLNILTEE